MSSEKARRWYETRMRTLKDWRKSTRNIYKANGFKDYPTEIYNILASLIHRGGKVVDLSCGNGLLLRHLVMDSGYELEPYGVDFIAESIEQARREVLPRYAENFTVANIIDYNLEPESFDFIFLDPFSVHKDDLNGFLRKFLRACRPRGKVIFYTYRDVLGMLLILSVITRILPPPK